MNGVEIRGLDVRAGSRRLLQLPRLEIGEGERVAIVGPNGAGKSTLLRVLAGFQRFHAGDVRVLGRELGASLARPALRALRAEVGQVHQGLHLVGRLTARENVLIGALARVPGWRSWMRWFPPALVLEADEALAAVGLLARADERVDRLSGGERQKLAIARMKLQRPRLILADEPTSNLDPSAADEACRWLADAARGASLITVVHQLPLLPLLADRVIGLQQGRLVLDRSTRGVDLRELAALYGGGRPQACTRVDTDALRWTLQTATGAAR